jgi:hypothetical protein
MSLAYGDIILLLVLLFDLELTRHSDLDILLLQSKRIKSHLRGVISYIYCLNLLYP